MRTLTSIVAAAALVTAVLLGQQSAPHKGSTPVEGVWRVVAQTINDRTLSGEQLGVGFHIYTAGHFAVVRESDVPPRPNITDVENATAKQLLDVWGPFVAQLGTYVVSGDLITEKVVVAKNPSNQSSQPNTRRFRFEGDVLVTEPIQRTPGARSITLKMVRVE